MLAFLSCQLHARLPCQTCGSGWNFTRRMLHTFLHPADARDQNAGMEVAAAEPSNASGGVASA